MPNADIRANQFTDKDTGQVVRFKDSVATFSNVDDMKAFPGLREGQKVRTLGYYAPGDGGGCDYEIVASGTATSVGFLYEELPGSGLEAKLLGGGIMEDKTAYIPSDYATLQDAIDDLSPIITKQGATITLMIESGHQPTSGVSVSNGDYRHFRIASESGTVALSSDYSGMFVEAEAAVAPALGCLVDAQKHGGDGYHLRNGSSGVVEGNCGVLNAGNRGLYLSSNSRCYARRCDFSGAWNRGLWVTRNSSVDVEFATFDYCNESAAVASANSVRRGSSVNAQDASFSNNYNTGIHVTRASAINLAGAKINNNAGGGLRCERASLASLEGSGEATVNNNASTGVRAFNGGIIQAAGIEVSGNGADFSAATGLIFSDGSTVTGGQPARRVYTSIVKDEWIEVGDHEEGARFNAETHYYEAWGTYTADLTTSGLQKFSYPMGLNLSDSRINSITHSFSAAPHFDQRAAIQSGAVFRVAGESFNFSCDGSGSGTRPFKLYITGRQEGVGDQIS